MKKRWRLALAAVWTAAVLTGCGGGIRGSSFPGAGSESPQAGSEKAQETVDKEQTAMKMNVQIGDKTFTATLEDNRAAAELVEIMAEGPVTLQMDDYSGFEKVGSLGRSLTADNSRITTTSGDIVLYNGSSIVMFYGSNSWSYTRLGKIDDLTGWTDALGRGSVTAILALAD